MENSTVETWPVLVERLAKCCTCHEDGLLESKARPLFCKFRGTNSDLLFILEAPNRGDTFDANKGYLTIDGETDPSGRFFRELYEEILGEPTEQALITNAVLYLPLKSRGRYIVNKKTMRNCSSNLRDQILSLDPLLVVSIGTKALEATRIIEYHKYRRLREAVAKPISWFGRTLFAVYHTGMLARNGPSGRSGEQQKQDWLRLRELLERLRTAGDQRSMRSGKG